MGYLKESQLEADLIEAKRQHNQEKLLLENQIKGFLY